MTQGLLKEILLYCPLTGQFIWKINANTKHSRIGAIANTLNKDGYIIIGYKNKKYKAHRLAWLYMYGKLPKEQIDHINHIRTDNRMYNLREVTSAENQKNRTMSKNNNSSVMGVNWHYRDKRWRAFISVDKKYIHLGNFIEFHEAVNARKNAEVLYGFHENHGKA